MCKPLLMCMFAGLVSTLTAQTALPRTIQATGTANLSVIPNQATLQVSVITQAATAQQAAQQNGPQTTAVTNALKQVLGSSGAIQTSGYYVSPRYSNLPGPNETIIGYTATNSLQVTINDTSLAGPVIDAANAAGASSVGGLSFGLRDPEPSKQQALAAAAKQGLAHASAIASGLGGQIGVVLSAQESAAVFYPLTGVSSSAGGGTPIQSGTVIVTATVTVTVQLM